MKRTHFPRLIDTFLLVLLSLLLFSGCAQKETDPSQDSVTEAPESPEELYEKALTEDVLVVYTVSSRIAEAKESFEGTYPGLLVDMRDLRSPDLVAAIERDYESGVMECDLALCNATSGEFKERLVDTGILACWVPEDIAPHLKTGITDGILSYCNEAELLFYSGALYDTCPVDNLWALTEKRFQGRIYMPNPLRSYSTYTLCASFWDEAERLKEAYQSYTGAQSDPSDETDYPKLFWERLSQNCVFTNSSDEVAEALKNGDADLGFMVSSKLRLKSLGYEVEPVYRLEPFCGCQTSYGLMLSAHAKNIHAAKLFIRFLLGEREGDGEGLTPFLTPGTWSVREDVPDGNPVPLEELDLILPKLSEITKRRAYMDELWSRLLKERNP